MQSRAKLCFLFIFDDIFCAFSIWIFSMRTKTFLIGKKTKFISVLSSLTTIAKSISKNCEMDMDIDSTSMCLRKYGFIYWLDWITYKISTESISVAVKLSFSVPPFVSLPNSFACPFDRCAFYTVLEAHPNHKMNTIYKSEIIDEIIREMVKLYGATYWIKNFRFLFGLLNPATIQLRMLSLAHSFVHFFFAFSYVLPVCFCFCSDERLTRAATFRCAQCGRAHSWKFVCARFFTPYFPFQHPESPFSLHFVLFHFTWFQ